MSEQDDAARVAAIRARVEAATPGPWLTPTEHSDPYAVEVVDHEGCLFWPWRDERDMVFAYAAREDVPWLLERLTRAERERDEARAALARCREALAGVTQLEVRRIGLPFGVAVSMVMAAEWEWESVLRSVQAALQDAPAPPVWDDFGAGIPGAGALFDPSNDPDDIPDSEDADAPPVGETVQGE